MENFSSPSATATCGAVRRAAAMLLTVIMAFAGAQTAGAQTIVSTDDELRTAIATGGSNITVTADINLSNSTLEIKENTAVTIDLGGHTLSRNLKWHGESGGQVITVRENATLNLSNGTLKGGWGGSGGGIQNYGTANLTGVTIKDNIGDDCGGGICNYRTMTIDGCTITGNKARKLGGGIWNTGTLNVKGAITLTGNTASSGMVNNLYLTHSAVVTVTGSLEGSTIGMSLQDVNGTFTSGYSTYNSGEPSTVFSGDLSEIVDVSTDAKNEAQLESKLSEGSIYYIERSWDSENKVVTAEIKVLEEGDYNVLSGSDGERTIGVGYHVVKNNISVNGGVNVSINGNDDTSYLILCDGAKLTTPYVCVKNENASGQFHIFGQMGDTGEIYNKNGLGEDDYPGVGSMGNRCTINIHGGQFEIEAGYNAAGIGGGNGSCGGTLNIFGGEFDVKGGVNAAGIGGGKGASCNNINIYGGRIYAYSEGTNGGTGIGGDQNATGGTVSITGGSINATGKIAISGNVTVTGGTLTATYTNTTDDARTRSEWESPIKNLAIYGNLALSGPATVTLNGYVSEGVTIADGMTFTDGTNNYSGTLGNEKQTAIQGKTLSLAALQLADVADNTAVIANCNGATGISVTLSGRTIYKDGDWNTLVLPFALGDATAADGQHFDGTPLEGFTVMELDTETAYEGHVTGLDGSTLYLNFKDATSITAGVPYIVRKDGTGGIENPVFTDVTISKGLNDVAFTGGAFIGTYSPTTLPAGDASNLYLGAGNTLYWPAENGTGSTVNAFRAYFHLGNGAGARQFVLNFGDENDATGIRSMDNGQWIMDNCWYDMQGRKLSKKPTQKGIYIKNGKKIIIK